MKYKVLIIGGGGREHALAWTIKKDQKVDKIFCLPGNGGTSLIAENILLDINNFEKIYNFVDANNIYITI